MSDAGFWKRCASASIDGIITVVGGLVVGAMFAVIVAVGLVALCLNFVDAIADWNGKR